MLTHRYSEYRVHSSGKGKMTYEFAWQSDEDIVTESLASWMNSPSHRANLLSQLYVAAGVGIAHADNEALFITVTFSFLAFKALAAK